MKLAIINRGVPGSGKSSFIETLREMAPDLNIKVHSTDDLCMVDGKYCFDYKLAKERHRQNRENFTKSLESDVNIVICDNTNIKPKDYIPYVQSAMDNGYTVLAVVFYPSDIEKHLARNTHGLTEDILVNMKRNLMNNRITVPTENITEEYTVMNYEGERGSNRIKTIINSMLKHK